MVSPAVAPTKKMKNITEADNYAANKGSSDYFDTYITLEKSDIKKKEDINEESVKSAKWTRLDSNDDSSELHAQPSGSKYNSLLRYESDPSNPLKALSVGLYRVGFTTYKAGEVKGTFLAQIGSPVKLPGVIISKELSAFK